MKTTQTTFKANNRKAIVTRLGTGKYSVARFYSADAIKANEMVYEYSKFGQAKSAAESFIEGY